jgi:putative ABC transport system ATP-binding protein
VILALNEVSLTITPGKLYAVIGPSGCGKSTLLNLMGTLERPSSGRITGFGQPLHQLGEGGLLKIRREKIGFVFQSFNLIANLSARENIELALELSRHPNRTVQARECMELAGFPLERQNHRPAKLSGGECQRVAIARALANDPQLILADEPTGNLDSKTGRQILDLLANLARKQGKAVIMVTHDHSLAKQADEIIRLKDGKIVS